MALRCVCSFYAGQQPKHERHTSDEPVATRKTQLTVVRDFWGLDTLSDDAGYQVSTGLCGHEVEAR